MRELKIHLPKCPFPEAPGKLVTRACLGDNDAMAKHTVLTARNARSGWWLAFLLGCLFSARADIIWSDLGSTLARDTGPGTDILGGAVQRDDASTDTLFFKFHVNPISDAGTEPYFAAFELYEGDHERLALGNALSAWAYGAFNVADVDKTNFNVFETSKTNDPAADYGVDFHSSKPVVSETYELPRKGIEKTIVAKVQYFPGGKDRITVWLDPDLGPGATETSQRPALTTTFTANASFNQIRLRHGGGGDGWVFSAMAIATSFSDFVMDDNSGNSSATGIAVGRGELPFTFRKWQREEGLPQNFVRALAQTQDGYLWIGSDAGVSRFDGVRFVSFGLAEGFQVGPVQAMLGDKSGALWIGSMGKGLGRWQNRQFTAYDTNDGLPSDSVNTLAEDGAGRIWIGTETGLAVFDQRRVHTVALPGALSGKPITSLFSDRQGTLWIGLRGEGLFTWQDGRIFPVTSSIFDRQLKDLHCLLVDHEGRVWVGAGEASVLYREGKQWRRYSFPRRLARNYVSSLAEDGDGTVWAGSSSDGLFQFRHGKLVAVNAGSGLSDNLVETLLADREGKLWVGTHGGLNRLRARNLSVISYNEGLGNGPVQSLAEVAPNVIWAAKSGEGVKVWDGRYFRALSVAGNISGQLQAGSLLTTDDGSCWMGGVHGLFQFKDVNKIELEAPSRALTNQDISALGTNAQGELLAGTRQGEIWRQHAGEWEMLRQGPAAHAVTAIVPQNEFLLWIGTAGDGLFSVDERPGGGWKKCAGLPSDWVRVMSVDTDGTLWIGTGGGGLSALRGGRLESFTMREGLPDNTISQILPDGRGNLWLGGDRGIFCVNKQELEQVAAHTLTAVSPRVYGLADGMLSEECISGFSPVGLKTKAGLLWFPTQEGIVVIDPKHQEEPRTPPTVVLEETLVDGVPKPGDSLRLSPGKHWLEFHYTGVDFDAPERVRFRYRLNGLDSDWREAGPSRAASFPFVPYGDYRFEVVASVGDGAWSKPGPSVAVAVPPFFWQSWWFRLPASFSLLLLIAVVVRIAEQRKLKRQLDQLEHERLVAHERERIARDLHDDLGSSLARISLLSGLLKADRDNPGQVENHAVKISQSANQTVRALEEIVWAVRPRSDSLQSLVEYIAHFANELFDGSEVRCRLDLPSDVPDLPLPPDVRHNAFLVVKEALTNTLKHAHASEVRLCVQLSPNTMEIVVQDNGKGFDVNKQSRGNGLGNMGRRAEAMGEKVAIVSAVGSGTTVRLSLHFAHIRHNGKAAA